MIFLFIYLNTLKTSYNKIFYRLQMFIATNRKEEMTLMITKPNFKPGQNLRPIIRFITLYKHVNVSAISQQNR